MLSKRILNSILNTLYVYSSHPQRLIRPSIRETHSGGVYVRVISKKFVDFDFHIVIGRNNVQKILNNTKAEKHFLLVD